MHVLLNVFGLVPRTAKEGDFYTNCLSSDILIYWKRFTESGFYIFYSDIEIKFLYMVSMDIMFTTGTWDSFLVRLLQLVRFHHFCKWYKCLFVFKQVGIFHFWFRYFF